MVLTVACALTAAGWQRVYPHGTRSVGQRSRRRSGGMHLLRMRVVLLAAHQPEPQEYLLAQTAHSKFEVHIFSAVVAVLACSNQKRRKVGGLAPAQCLTCMLCDGSVEKGELAHRHFPQFKMRLRELPECLESFPSGDSAGAGAFGFSAYLFTGQPLWLLGLSTFVFVLTDVWQQPLTRKCSCSREGRDLTCAWHVRVYVCLQ